MIIDDQMLRIAAEVALGVYLGSHMLRDVFQLIRRLVKETFALLTLVRTEYRRFKSEEAVKKAKRASASIIAEV